MTKFSDAVTEVLCAALRKNMPIKFACDYALVSERTFHEWMQEGREDIEAGLCTEKALFSQTIKKAQADCVQEGLERIQTAANDPKIWTAQAWLMERVHRKQFGVNADMYEEMDKRLSEIERRQQQNSLPDVLKDNE